MRITKKKILDKFGPGLKELKYSFIQDSITAAQALFIKKLENSFYLGLGFTLSNLYVGKFTVSYYLSKTTRWGSMWGDIPRESYKRIGIFLTSNERLLLLDKEYNSDGIVDAWWSLTDHDIANVLKVVEITELRFLQQEQLFEKIQESVEVKKMANLSACVLKTVNQLDNVDFTDNFLFQEKNTEIPLEWFVAAEKCIVDHNEILNKNTVKNLAGDAWRQYLLSYEK